MLLNKPLGVVRNNCEQYVSHQAVTIHGQANQ